MLTVRENYLRAVRRQDPDWVPWYTWFTEPWEDRLQEKLGRRDYANYFQYPWRTLRRPKRELHELDPDRFRKYYADVEIPSNARFDGMGVLRIPGSMYHFTHMVHPMRNFTTVKEVLDYPWPPDPPPVTDAELEGMRKEVREYQEAGWPVLGGGGGCFESGWALRGMDNMLCDLITGNEVSETILDWFTERGVLSARISALAGVDQIGGGDDVGMQDRMILDPELWRRTLKPRIARVFAAGRDIKPDIHVAYHSDGYIEPIIPDLIEIGVDILNPIQPECMDQEKIKRLYGDRLCLDRCIGTQTTLPFGTPESIDAKVKWTIETLGKGGGLIIGPTHAIEPDVTWENFVAFYRAVMKYGGYDKYPGQMPRL